MRNSKRKMAQHYGLLCFSRSWHNPMLWSQYADSHRGICLGFEVNEKFFAPVGYVKDRIPLQLPLSPTNAKQLLFTKYRDWRYEEELRGWVRLKQRDASTGLYFYSFDERVQLREVVAGPSCATPKAIIEAAVKGYKDRILLMKARLAFKTFRVVKDKRGFRR